ncbi:hypothetical protein [Convivina praedatoris]|uniref:Uncharacterized protein n=1 Tax=Convivina praedatoris TaxID=2880963 RepID=A0ABN8HCF3_9LACO|nr:hypothetical protein [Convivina sp. LMG 32447]CAH1851806.1 hypothetical protein LMG032447_00411 [Convivina sp. LMG 32447]CAH1851832.1 hypothetical protein R078138_00421 [Convivina sp. LMG 32447]CAH1853041.1 hypothetical protein R077815_00696 [Convivina sp. LMG 32447]
MWNYLKDNVVTAIISSVISSFVGLLFTKHSKAVDKKIGDQNRLLQICSEYISQDINLHQDIVLGIYNFRPRGVFDVNSLKQQNRVKVKTYLQAIKDNFEMNRLLSNLNIDNNLISTVEKCLDMDDVYEQLDTVKATLEDIQHKI